MAEAAAGFSISEERIKWILIHLDRRTESLAEIAAKTAAPNRM
jgi:hypothetical protein